MRFPAAPVLSLGFAFSYDPTGTISKPLKQQHLLQKRSSNPLTFRDLEEKPPEGSFDELLIARRGNFHEPRNIAVGLLRQIRGESLNNRDEQFNVKAYSSVSSMLR
jgi:hypothetical protein